MLPAAAADAEAFSRWAAKSWLAGDPPTWCPLIDVGVPGFGQADGGALDLFGMLAALVPGAVLVGIGVAGVGAALLAHRLGLRSHAALLVGVVVALARPFPPLLPWFLLFLEGSRGRRPVAAAGAAALVLQITLLGRGLESAACIVALGGFYALAVGREDRRAGALALLAVLLGTAGAAVRLLAVLEARPLVVGMPGFPPVPELLALGILMVLVGLVLSWQRWVVSEAGGRGSWAPGLIGLGLAFGGAVLLLTRKTSYPPPEPGIGFVALALALAALLSPTSRLGRRGVLVAAGTAALLLGGAPAGAVTVLCLAMLAGDGLALLSRPRWAAPAVVLLATVSLAWRPHEEERPRPRRTEALLARHLGQNRALADPAGPDWLAPEGLAGGVRVLGPGTERSVRTYLDYRTVLRPLGSDSDGTFHAHGVDLADPFLRLFGVGMLVLREPTDHPDWSLVGGPEGSGAPEEAELLVLGARDPFPRAFCVPRVVSPTVLADSYLRDAHGWDPLDLAGLAEDWRPRRPFERATVELDEITNAELRVSARLDGEGLLVVTEQAFPGWTVTVDGAERPLLTANGIFRAVALEAGEHDVLFRYRPASIRIGGWVSFAAFLAILVLLGRGLLGPAGLGGTGSTRMAPEGGVS